MGIYKGDKLEEVLTQISIARALGEIENTEKPQGEIKEIQEKFKELNEKNDYETMLKGSTGRTITTLIKLYYGSLVKVIDPRLLPLVWRPQNGDIDKIQVLVNYVNNHLLSEIEVSVEDYINIVILGNELRVNTSIAGSGYVSEEEGQQIAKSVGNRLSNKIKEGALRDKTLKGLVELSRPSLLYKYITQGMEDVGQLNEQQKQHFIDFMEHYVEGGSSETKKVASVFIKYDRMLNKKTTSKKWEEVVKRLISEKSDAELPSERVFKRNIDKRSGYYFIISDQYELVIGNRYVVTWRRGQGDYVKIIDRPISNVRVKDINKSVELYAKEQLK